MSAATQSPPSRHAPRSKNGCRTCRLRKLKCDEIRPACHRCVKAQIRCEWFEAGQGSLQRRGETASTSQSPLSSSSSWPKPNTSLRRLAPANLASPGSMTATDDPHDGAGTDREGESLLYPDASSSKNHPDPDPRVSNDDEVVDGPRPQHSLSAAHVALSNSLRLSVEDQECFLYVPDSVMVLRFGKPWKWSSISYIYANIAGRYAGVMRIFIAGAAMELRSSEILARQDGNNIDDLYSRSNSSSSERARRLGESAASHYHLALKDLSALLDHIARSLASSDDLDALFAMWFLILHFGLYDSESIGASHVHLDGIRSFLKSHLQQEDGETMLPLASQQLLLYISYMDINFALGNPNGGRLWMDLLSETTDSPISNDRLFHRARSCLPKIWGAQYPTSELFDDIENYRPLHFLHSCQRPKVAILRLTTAAAHGQSDEEGCQRLWKQIKEIGQDFADVLTLAAAVPDSGGRRMIWTVYHAALEYYALQMLYSCLDPTATTTAKGQPQSRPWLDTALRQVSAIAYKAMGEDPRQVYRLAWPLCITLLKTTDSIHQDWLRGQLMRANILLPHFGLHGLARDGTSLLGSLLESSQMALQASQSVSVPVPVARSQSRPLLKMDFQPQPG